MSSGGYKPWTTALAGTSPAAVTSLDSLVDGLQHAGWATAAAATKLPRMVGRWRRLRPLPACSAVGDER
ncbi:hypothetical protein HaLaN_06723 [Haematococcus lacustris]|uniref:Uncharacterized protein n=1 Tax=Haematococcus lacustris TaxID=44745 RepID=A0A699Z6Y7_HAELA|nr:hypothetical protein HaLaN_06723 [Haematococcus lacustris]